MHKSYAVLSPHAFSITALNFDNSNINAFSLSECAGCITSSFAHLPASAYFAKTT